MKVLVVLVALVAITSSIQNLRHHGANHDVDAYQLINMVGGVEQFLP